jgi:hypothetical protein
MKYLVAAAMVVATLGVVSADPHEYVNVTGDQFVLCDSTGATISQGGVCWDGGHIVPDAAGQATLSLTDDLFSPVSGYYCQDVNADTTCGDSAAGEPSAIFCGALTVTDGSDWSSGGLTMLFADGAVFGNPVLSACGTLSASVHGFGNHS